MRDHARIEELLAVGALGGLEPADIDLLERERAQHGPGCEECARLEREYGEVAGRLAFALTPVPAREGLEDEVLVRALGRIRGQPQRSAAWRRLALVAAAAALLGGGWVLRDLTIPAGPDRVTTEFLSGASIVRFQGAAQGRLAVAFRPNEPGAYLLGAGLPEPSPGDVYELWLFRDGQPVSGGCFVPEDGTVLMTLDTEVGTAELLAITVESAACPSAPTTEPILTADPSAI
jgi:hypothetical protein